MQYDDYFSWRNVSPDTYKNYQIPAYLGELFSKSTSLAILDFGCGFGQLLSALKEKGYSHIEGADINPLAIEYLKGQSITVHNLDELPSFYIDFAERYDYVVMNHVLEHISKEQIIPQLSQILSLLKPDGALIVSVPNAQSNTGCYWAYEDFTHHTLFTSGSIYYVLRGAGFTNVNFIDVDCSAEDSSLVKAARKILLGLYKLNITFWNKITKSAFHDKSPIIFSYEIKAIARR